MLKSVKKPLKQWLLELETKHNKKIDLGLSRIKRVYDRLKLNKISSTIITVAGTNGKGSTVSILSSILQQSCNVGEFTSPHLLKYNERIKINGKPVEDIEIVSAFEIIEENLQEVTLSYFEYSTLAAAIIFKNNKVDVSILEVGLGGRLDSVNVIDADCSVITTVDIDHTAWLGNDIETIGFEKAGIFRANKPAIYGDINCPESIKKHAESIKSSLVILEEDYKLKINSKTFDYSFSSFDYKSLPKPNIQGDWQFKNAATAITALNCLDLNIKEIDIRKGLERIQLKGRLQKICDSPAVYVDVSHNEQAAISLSSWLNEHPNEGRTFAVFAVLDDKQVVKWLKYFSSAIDTWLISEVKSERTLKRIDLLTKLSDYSELILSFDSVQQAYNQAKSIALPQDRLIVFGSFYTVSEVLESIEAQ